MALPSVGGLIQKLSDINLVPNPPVGSQYLGIDLDGDLKMKLSDGTIVPIGGGGGGTVSGTPSQIAYFGADGSLTSDSHFYKVSGSIAMGITYGTGSIVSIIIGTSQPGGNSDVLLYKGIPGGEDCLSGIIDTSIVSSEYYGSGFVVRSQDSTNATQSTFIVANNKVNINSFEFLYDSGYSTFIFPKIDGTSGQAITTDGAGNLTFSTVGGSASLTTTFTTGTYSIHRGYSVEFVPTVGFPPTPVTMSGIFSTDGTYNGFIGISSVPGDPIFDPYIHNIVTIGSVNSSGYGSGIDLLPYNIFMSMIGFTGLSYSTVMGLYDTGVEFATTNGTQSSSISMYYDNFSIIVGNVDNKLSGGTSAGFGVSTDIKPYWSVRTQGLSASSSTFYLPSSYGSAGQVLSDNGSGELYWQSAGALRTTFSSGTVSVSNFIDVGYAVVPGVFTGSGIWGTSGDGIIDNGFSFMGMFDLNGQNGSTYSYGYTTPIIYSYATDSTSIVFQSPYLWSVLMQPGGIPTAQIYFVENDFHVNLGNQGWINIDTNGGFEIGVAGPNIAGIQSSFNSSDNSYGYRPGWAYRGATAGTIYQFKLPGSYGVTGSVLTDNGTGDLYWNDIQPYRKYVALLNQSGTTPPVSTVLENTLGFVPLWSYTNVGSYELSYAGGFPLDKTFIMIESPYDENLSYNIKNDIRDINSIPLLSVFSGLATNDALINTSIEIRVYN